MPNAAQPMNNNALIELRDVRYRVREAEILRDIHLRVHAGERVALLGANGAGKTSLLRLINGLISASAGAVNVPSIASQAMLFQKPPLLRRNVLDNVAFALRARGMNASDAEQVSQQTLNRCGLSGLSHRYARALSGGEQQKLALARAWVTRPMLLLADEATASLAPAAVHEVEHLLLEICDQGSTLVFATHNRGQAKRLATRIVFMSEGRVIEDRATEDFFANPVSQEAIDYINVERV
jgi:tungstate transport system ATP-binding protein